MKNLCSYNRIADREWHRGTGHTAGIFSEDRKGQTKCSEREHSHTELRKQKKQSAAANVH